MPSQRKINLKILRKDGTVYHKQPKGHFDVDGGFVQGRDGWVAPLEHGFSFTSFDTPWFGCKEYCKGDGSLKECKGLCIAAASEDPGYAGKGDFLHWGMKTRALGIDAQGMLLSADTFWQDDQARAGEQVQGGANIQQRRRLMNRALQDRCEQAAVAATDERKIDREIVRKVAPWVVAPFGIVVVILGLTLLPGAFGSIDEIVQGFTNRGGVAQVDASIPSSAVPTPVPVPTATPTVVPTPEPTPTPPFEEGDTDDE